MTGKNPWHTPYKFTLQQALNLLFLLGDNGRHKPGSAETVEFVLAVVNFNLLTLQVCRFQFLPRFHRVDFHLEKCFKIFQCSSGFIFLTSY